MAHKQAPLGDPHGAEYGRQRNLESTIDPSSSGLPDELVKKMPPGTSETWLKIAPILPTSAYLSGGTALIVHLMHRVSRDLDIFLERPEDLRTLWTQFQHLGDARATRLDDSTIHCVIDGTRVQVIEAATLKMVSPLTVTGGMRVASVNDIMAMKLKVIVDRGELRDYFDIMTIEESRRVMAETGLAFALEKYSPTQPDQFIKLIVVALGTLDDVEDDPALPVSKDVVVDYWMKRQRSLMKHIAMFGG